jgi:hypothetical protein
MNYICFPRLRLLALCCRCFFILFLLYYLGIIPATYNFAAAK